MEYAYYFWGLPGSGGICYTRGHEQDKIQPESPGSAGRSDHGEQIRLGDDAACG